MHERVRQYLETQKKHINTRELHEKARVLIEAELYDSYQGPHVEELFEPIIPNKTIREIEDIQYVVEKATGNVIGVKFNPKDKEFIVMTPLDVTEEEFAQIKRYKKPMQLQLNPAVLSVCAYVLYVIALGFFMSSLIFSTFHWGYIIGSISIIDGMIIHILAVIVKHIKK